MQEYLSFAALAIGTFAAVLTWLRTGGAKAQLTELQESLDEIRHDLYEDLRADIAAAIAEGVDAVLAKLPQPKAPKQPKPAAPPEAPASGAMKS
jgi:hypothetical protein